MEQAERVDFYEVWSVSGVLLGEIGIYGNADSKPEADRIAGLMGGEAHFDRTGIVYIP